MMAQAPWEKYAATPQGAPPPPGVLGTIPGRVDPYKARDQELQEEAAARAREDQAFQREKFEREMAKADKPKEVKPTGEAKSAAGFYARALNAHQLYGAGVEPRGVIGQMAADMAPRSVVNKLSSPERREAQNFADEFIRAKLRKESGAVIAADEMQREYEVYFPMPGDGPDDLARKTMLREQAIEGLKVQAGQEAENVRIVGAASDANKTTDGEHIYEGGQPQSIELSKGGTQRIDDPLLAGVNAKINEMLKSGLPGGDIAAFIQQAGVPVRSTNLPELIAWRKKNPQYKGDYTVNIDDKLVPMSGLRSAIASAASSPLAAGAVASADVLSGGHLDNLIELGGGSGEVANMGMGLLRQENPTASLVGDVAGGVGLYATGRGALGIAGRGAAPATGTFAPRAIVGDAAMGGYIGSGSNGTDIFSPSGTLMGAAAGAGGGVVGRGGINTVARALSPTGNALAPAYAEGVQPTIGQRMGGVVNRAEQAFANIPLVGGIQRSARNESVKQWQVGAFNKALREIGTELPKGTPPGIPAHKYMQQQFNEAYGKARSELTFRRDSAFDTEFSDLVKNEVAILGEDGQRIFKSFVDRGSNLLNVRGGVLSGSDYKNTVSRIEKKVRALRQNPKGDTELADALEGLVIALDKGARRHSAPEAVAAIDAADRGYVMAALIEEAGRKSGSDVGEFTGKQLERAVVSNSGRRSRQALRGEAPLQDYAAAGTRLGQTMPDSGSAERFMYGATTAGAMGGASVAVNPFFLAPWAIDTLANLPGARQAVNLLLAPNRRGLDPARRRLMERAHLGGLLLSAPAAQATAPE